MSATGGHFFDAYYANAAYELGMNDEIEPPISSEQVFFVPVQFLTGIQKWPDHAAQMLRQHMEENDFYNFCSTRQRDIQLLERITTKLRSLFDPDLWMEEYEALLKQKVQNKIHRIRSDRNKNRAEEERVRARENKLQAFKEALYALEVEHIEEARNLMVERFRI